MTPSRRRRSTPALAAVAGLLLTGCAAGSDAQTLQRRSFSEGTNVVVDEAGQLLVRNLYLAPPPQVTGRHVEGGDVRAYGVFYNQGSEPDRLVSASSPIAESVSFYTGGSASFGLSERTEQFLEFAPPPTEPRPGGPDTRSVPEEGAGPAQPGAEPAQPGAEPAQPGAEPAQPGATPAPRTSDGEQVDEFVVPQGDTVEVLPGTGYLLLEGLERDLFPGQVVPVTLQFERAGTVTFDTYVHVLGEPFEREDEVVEEVEAE